MTDPSSPRKQPDSAEQFGDEDALANARADLSLAARTASMGVMAAAIAHEVSQPLLGILTNAELCVRMLTRETPNLEGAIEASRRVIRDGNRASSVINRLRSLYSQKDGVSDSFHFDEAAREALEISKFELRREKIEIQERWETTNLSVLGDRIQIQQVMLNLLRNAIESMTAMVEKQRSIVVRTGCTASHVSFSVQDSGAGFKEEAKSRLFEAFYTTKPCGMGVGLSVSHSIVEAHRGTLWGRNLNEGGAIFGFDLPIRDGSDLK